MKCDMVVERVRRVDLVRHDQDAVMSELESSLHDLRTIRAFCDASEAHIARRIAAASSFPEAKLAEGSRGSLGAASKTMDRTRTLDAVPALADALDQGDVTAGHVDAVTRAAKGLEPAQRQQLYDRVDELVDVASSATVEQFGRRIRSEVNRIMADDGMDRLERQRRATSMSTWTDAEGMWNVSGRFDPVTALSVSAALDRAVETLFAEAVPDSCPSDPIEKQKHLRALAFARLVTEGAGGAGRNGRPEFVAVIDADAPDRAGPVVDWPIPIEVPTRVLHQLMHTATVTPVVVRNGVILHAPGTLDLGRSTRLANRAQRRALRGLYRECAIPGCTVAFDRCKLHHIVWWRHGGSTNLANLIPVCSQHHANIHNDGWLLELGRRRELTLRLPDGTVRNTGPPRRDAA